jgi:hypothetical protein
VGGSCGWPQFEIATRPAIISAIGAHNANNPADATQGLYSQMFGAGKVHPKTVQEMVPAGLFNGGVNRLVSGLTAGREHLLICWMKYEFRGMQPAQLQFFLGVDPTGQTADGNAATIDWGVDQITDKAKVHEIFTHVWRTFTPTSSTASIWLRAHHPIANPSVMFYTDEVEVRQLTPPPGPAIGLSTTLIELETPAGVNPVGVTFTIANAGLDTINYTLTDDVPWLSVTPASGNSSGEADTINVVFNVAGLAGAHTATITATSPEATNSPQTITVKLTIPTVPADFDQDGDVDQADFGHLQECFTGSGLTQTDPDCADARLDADEDVDLNDFSIFQSCMGGAGQPPAPACEN